MPGGFDAIVPPPLPIAATESVACALKVAVTTFPASMVRLQVEPLVRQLALHPRKADEVPGVATRVTVEPATKTAVAELQVSGQSGVPSARATLPVPVPCFITVTA